MSANRLLEMGAADEMVSSTVFAIYKDGTTRAIWSGLVSINSMLKADNSYPVDQVSSGSNGHTPDTGFAVLAGTSDSSVTVIAGQAFLSTGPPIDPPTIPSRGNSENCRFTITFEKGTYYQGLLQFPNGVSGIVVIDPDGNKHTVFGLGFTVSGSVTSGGIGHVGAHPNPQNPNGTWTIDQWTSSWNQRDGRFVVVEGRPQTGGPAWRDINPQVPFKAYDNTFSWYDLPSDEGWGINRFQNFSVKVHRGDEYCQADFHFTKIQRGPGYEVHWAEGLLR
jgi:hypothetical protein